MKLKLLVPVALVMAALIVPVVPPAAANHEYVQSVWKRWPSPQLDILIAGVQDPFIGASIQRAINAWDVGIRQLSPTLAAELKLRVYWPGSVAVPPLDVSPDIVVAPQGFMAALTLGKCVAFAPMLVGWGSFYRVTSHEIGHCLGLSHVFNHGVEYSPGFDIMGGGDGPKCPSNLNVKLLERALHNQGGTITMSASQYFQSDCE